MNTAFTRIALVMPPASRPFVTDASSNVSVDKTLRHGRFLFRVVALGLVGAGLFALLQSATGRFLAHDLHYLGMDTIQLCGVGNGHVARFS